MSRPVTDGIDLTDVQQEFVALAREFAAKEIRPRSREIDEADTVAPMDLWEKAAEVGLTSYMLPTEYGGGGITDLVTQCLVQQELCYGDISIANFLTSSAFFSEPILHLGNEEQKQRYISMLTDGVPPVTSVAVTEPGVGSDSASLQTRAVRDGDHYVLNGQKTWISNAPLSRYFVVFATIDPTLRSRGVTAFLVERDREGLAVGAPMKKYGQRGTLNAEVFLENVRVPVENRLGAEGQAFYGLMGTFDASRILIGAGATGLARAALDATIAYAHERTQFGKPIIEHQAVAFRIADMAARTDVAHLVTMRAARLFDAGKSTPDISAIAKLTASENTTWVCDAALMTHGGWGYSREYFPEKWLRDAKLEEIEEGTSDIQRLIISRAVSKPTVGR
ncbi:acyl-CoA dehydrogenase family protein [Intrasporangium sp.]|uniref:acyl-CoA dehydrogenase family protein n=1 Tax=Intrasporangium sp. TaxID=1925024 RepID=UPI003222201F